MAYTVQSFVSAGKELPSFEKNLSICLGTDGFSCAESSVKGELLSLGEVRFEGQPSMAEGILLVKQALADLHVSPMGMHAAQLVVNSDLFVWVPDSLYEMGKDRNYLSAVCDIPMGMSIFSEHNDDVKAQAVFAFDNAWISAFRIAVPGIKVRCQHSAFANADCMKSSDLKSVILVQVRQGRSDIMVLCNKKLQLSNTYAASSFDETVYHALNVTHQLRLNEADMEVLICGDVSRQQYDSLARFFPKVDLYKGRQLTLEGEMAQVPLHKYAVAL